MPVIYNSNNKKKFSQISPYCYKIPVLYTVIYNNNKTTKKIRIKPERKNNLYHITYGPGVPEHSAGNRINAQRFPASL